MDCPSAPRQGDAGGSTVAGGRGSHRSAGEASYGLPLATRCSYTGNHRLAGSAAGTSLEAAWRGSSMARNILSSSSSYAEFCRPDATARAVRREREYQSDQPGSQTPRREQPCQEPGTGKKTAEKEMSPSQGEWQERAANLLLLAAAQQTNVVTHLETGLSPKVLPAAPSLRLAPPQPATPRPPFFTP